MTDRSGEGGGIDGDDVEAHVVDAVHGPGTRRQPQLGETGDLAPFERADGVFGRAARVRAARLDLDEGEHGAAACDDVELAAADTDVAPQKAPAVMHEIAGRGLFGRAPEELPSVHRDTVAPLGATSQGADAAPRVTFANGSREVHDAGLAVPGRRRGRQRTVSRAPPAPGPRTSARAAGRRRSRTRAGGARRRRVRRSRPGARPWRSRRGGRSRTADG